MAPSLRASETPLEYSQRERKAIVRLTLAFIVVSLAAHWLFGAFYHPRKIVVQPEPVSTILVQTEKPTPTPTPAPRITPTPMPTARRAETAQSNASPHPPIIRPPRIPVAPHIGDRTPGPDVVPSPGDGGSNDLASAPPGTPQPVQTFAPCRIVRKVEPQYPDIVKGSGMQGAVSIVLLIGPHGEALSARVGESSGNQALDDAALAAARASTYSCPPAAGREAELYQVVYQFILDQ